MSSRAFERLNEKLKDMRSFERVIVERLKSMELEENIPPYTNIKVEVLYGSEKWRLTLLTRRVLNKRMLRHYIDTILEQERVISELGGWEVRLEEPMLTPEAVLLIERTLKDPTLISLTDHYALHRGACSIRPNLLLIHVPFSVERWHIFRFSRAIEEHVRLHLIEWLNNWKNRVYTFATYDLESKSLKLNFNREEGKDKSVRRVEEEPREVRVDVEELKKLWSLNA